MSNPLRTLIVDDEPLAVERLQIICARMPGISLVGTASDGESALRMADELLPDLLLLDITMPKLDGMGVARALSGAKARAGGHAPAIIFVTAYEGFAVEAFDLAAIDYVLKPVAPDRLERAVERVQALRKSISLSPIIDERDEADRWAREFWVPHRAELKRVEAEAIDRIEAERDYMRLFVGGRSYLLHETIKTLEERLNPAHFIRLHRSHIVRKDHISGLRHEGGGVWLAQLGDGEEIRIGRTYLGEAKKIAGR